MGKNYNINYEIKIDLAKFNQFFIIKIEKFVQNINLNRKK